MTTEQTGYSPINCEFHDLLEDLATLRKPAQISFRDEADELHRLFETEPRNRAADKGPR